MKKVLLMMLLMGGAVLTTYAQRGNSRGHGDHGHHGRGNGHWVHEERYAPRVYVRGRYDHYYHPPVRRVVYARPAYYPAIIPVPVPVPPPPPVHYYPARPRAVFHAGVTIVN